MPLARVYSYCKLLAFWLVGYGEQLTAFVVSFVVDFVGVPNSGTITPPYPSIINL